MSNDLQWMLLKKHNAFHVKRSGVLFSKEKGNLTNRNSYKFSGLVNKRVVSINAAGSKIQLRTKDDSVDANKKVVNKTVSIGQFKVKGKKVGAEAVRNATSKSFYRADLTQFALARYNALRKSIECKGTIKK
eukprot:355161_1